MLNLGNLWIELWEPSDIVFWVLTVVSVNSLLIFPLYHGRTWLESILSAGQIDRLLKFLILYLCCLQPVLSMIFLYRGIFGYVGPPLSGFGDGFIHEYKHYPVSYTSGLGVQWVSLLLLVVWIVGFLVYGFRSWIKDRAVLNGLWKFSRPCEDKRILCFAEEVSREIGMKKAVSVRVSSMVGAPFAVGSFQPEIFFPQKEYGEDETRLMLSHELTHCRRWDPFYRKVIFWFCSLYWFLPYMRCLAEYHTDINEMSCDDAVLEYRTKQERYLYAKALADMALQGEILRHAVSMTGHTESRLERRIIHMMNKKRKTGKTVFTALTVLILAACPLTTLAASEGMCSLQDVIVREVLFEDHEEVMNGGNTLVEETDVVEDFEMIPAKGEMWQSESMSVSTIREEISSARSMGSVTVSVGDEIYFALKGDPSSVSFRAGYINSSGRRTYVTTTNGKLNHTFSITKAGTYELFVEPLNNKTVYMEGTVTVM